jgi:hypothetical protein
VTYAARLSCHHRPGRRARIAIVTRLLTLSNSLSAARCILSGPAMSGNGWTTSPAGATIGCMSEPDAVPLPREGEVFFDVRGEARSMRLSWYADSRVAVFSIWQGNRCTGTFRLPFGELARMVHILQAGPRPYAAAGARRAPAQREPGPSRGYGTGHGHGTDAGYGVSSGYSAVPRYGPSGGAGREHQSAGHEAPYGLGAEPVTGRPGYGDVSRRRAAALPPGTGWDEAHGQHNEPAPGARQADPETSGLRRAAPAHIAQAESGWLGAPEPAPDSRPSDTNLLGLPSAPWHRPADSG